MDGANRPLKKPNFLFVQKTPGMQIVQLVESPTVGSSGNYNC